MRQLKNYSFGENNENDKDKSDADTVNDYIGKYKGMDEDALLNELMSTIKRNKEAGTFNDEQLLSFAQLVSPQLDDIQRTKLNNLIKVIKTEN